MEKMKRKNRLQNRRTGVTLALFIVVFILFTIYAASLLFPFVWGFISSFKTPREFIRYPLKFPAKWMFSNYSDAFTKLEYQDTTFPEMLWNSVWFSVGSVVISIFFITLTSYVCGRYTFRGRGIVYGAILFSLVIPLYGNFAATYRTYYKLHLVNGPLILLSATGAGGMNFILMSSYIRNVSGAYMEAARIDGAGHMQVFIHVAVPLVRPMIISLCLIGFIGHWNNYMSALLYMPKRPTLATGLYMFQQVVEKKGNYPTLFAGLMISCAPILLLYATIGKTMMENMAFGGLKG